jgi:23S rRNA pseudouridine1911/1915/1917 synthase
MSSQTHTFLTDRPGERLDRVLADLLPEISRAHIQSLIKQGLVSVDGDSVAKPSARLEGGERLSIQIPAAEPQALEAESIPLDIVYQDAEVIVVNKAPGMVVHPASGHTSGTLVNALLAHVPELALVGGTRRPGIFHRLDKDTSGLMVVALTEASRLKLKGQFQARTVRKEYLALVEGVLSPPAGLVDAPIARSKHRRKRMAIVQGGRPAQTEYRTLENFDAHTLVEALPKTGRTHQIRVHMAFLGHPLVGDMVYGRRKRTAPLKRHFLHAHQLTFIHPASGQELTLSSPLPGDLAHVLNWLRKQV